MLHSKYMKTSFNSATTIVFLTLLVTSSIAAQLSHAAPARYEDFEAGEPTVDWVDSTSFPGLVGFISATDPNNPGELSYLGAVLPSAGATGSRGLAISLIQRLDAIASVDITDWTPASMQSDLLFSIGSFEAYQLALQGNTLSLAIQDLTTMSHPIPRTVIDSATVSVNPANRYRLVLHRTSGTADQLEGYLFELPGTGSPVLVAQLSGQDTTPTVNMIQTRIAVETQAPGDLGESYFDNFFSSDAGNNDADGDGLSDVDELTVHLTQPYDNDSDNDGVDDGAEITLGSNPLDANESPLQTNIAATPAVGNGFFGWSVDIDGDTAVVGRPDILQTDAGAVYVFERINNTWTQQQILQTSTPLLGERFGYSVALQGDNLVVGTFGADAAPGGQAYIFTRTAGTWSQQQALSASNATFANSSFGSDVAIDDTTILIGANNAGATSAGAAYLFEPVGGIWTEQQIIEPIDNDNDDNFGIRVAVSGDTLAVTSLDDDGAGIDAGAVYIFSRSGGVWSEVSKLTGLDTNAGDGFGSDIVLRGDTLIAGAPDHDDIAADSGSAYVFIRDTTTGIWSETQQLVPNDRAVDHRFGVALGFDGTTLAIGALDEYEPSPGTASSGIDAGVYLYAQEGGLWQERRKVQPQSPLADNYFAAAVAISADSLLVGAFNEAAATGAAYIFDLDADNDGLFNYLETVGNVFVTSTVSNGNLGGTSGADASCNARALAAGLSGSFNAWLSTSTENAIDRIDDRPYQRLDGAWVATSLADLIDGSLISPIDRNEFNSIDAKEVWTGSLSDGTLSGSNCVDWTSSSFLNFARVGDSPATDADWTEIFSVSCPGSNALYCFGGETLNPFNPDSDGDGLLDGFEALYGFDPYVSGDAGSDPDMDGLDNLGEQLAGTNPLLNDTDGDGISDGDEVANGTDPLLEDPEFLVPIMSVYALLILAASLLYAHQVRRRKNI